MSIPADFRDVLQARDPDWTAGKSARFILQYADNLKDHLRIYSIGRIKEIREGIARMPEGLDKAALSYLYNAQTTQIEVDKDGRIVLPVRFREKLGLTEGEITFLGYGSYVEVWNSATYAATKSTEIARWLSSSPAAANPLGLIPDLPPG